MQKKTLIVSCNCCNNSVDGVAYRTACSHLLCPGCAKNSFVDGHTCIICGAVLSKGEVREAVIGVSAQLDVTDSLFQVAFSRTDFTDILENLQSMRCAFAELEKFVSAQLLHEASRQKDATLKILGDCDNLNDELYVMNDMIKENETKALNYQAATGNLLRLREKEMSEIKDAYKEKHRKCQAWEKAYNNIRDQVVVPTSVDSKRGEERDQYTRLVYPTNTDNNQSSNRHETSLPSGRHLQPPFLSPPPTNFQLNPSRALRRTEVTTYSKSFVPEDSYSEQSTSHGHIVKQSRPKIQQYADYRHIQMSDQSAGRQAPSTDLRTTSVSADGERYLHIDQRRYDPIQSQLKNTVPPAPYRKADSKKRIRNQAEIARGKSSFFD